MAGQDTNSIIYTTGKGVTYLRLKPDIPYIGRNKETGESVIIVSHPLYKGKQIDGVLLKFYGAEIMQDGYVKTGRVIKEYTLPKYNLKCKAYTEEMSLLKYVKFRLFEIKGTPDCLSDFGAYDRINEIIIEENSCWAMRIHHDDTSSNKSILFIGGNNFLMVDESSVRELKYKV